MKKLVLVYFLIGSLLTSTVHSAYRQNTSDRYGHRQTYDSRHKRLVAQISEYDLEPERIYPVERGSTSDPTPDDIEAQSRGYPSYSNQNSNQNSNQYPNQNSNQYANQNSNQYANQNSNQKSNQYPNQYANQ